MADDEKTSDSESIVSRLSTLSLASSIEIDLPFAFTNDATSDFFYMDLKRRVESVAKKIRHKFNKVEYGISTTNQMYAILVLQGIMWNTVYLFVQDPWLHFGPNYRAALRRVALRSSHLSNSGTDHFVKRVHAMFNKPTLTKISEIFGDIVLTKWYLSGIYHAGIYIGNGKVIHRSGGGSKKLSQSFPKEGSLIDDFAGGEKATKFIVRIRSNEEIAKIAKEYAKKANDDKSITGKWLPIFNDCQKFVTMCATGEFDKWDGPFKLNHRH